MNEVFGSTQEQIFNHLNKYIEHFVTDVDYYEDLTGTEYKVSLKQGGFTEDDCKTQMFYNENLSFMERTNSDAIELLTNGTPIPEDYYDEYNRRIKKNIAFYLDLYKKETPYALLCDGNQEPRLYQFDSEKDYINICTRSLRNEFSDSDMPGWEREEMDLDELEEMLLDESVNHHIILYFKNLGFLSMGSLEQTHTLLCLPESNILKEINYIHTLAEKHGLYSWKNEPNSWES